MNRRATLLTGLTMGALAVTGCANLGLGRRDTQVPSTAIPFKVLMMQDLSGPLATLGQAEVQGMNASAAVINGRGGIQGRAVQVDVVDDLGDATKAVSLLTERITNGNIPAVVQGGTTSAETLAMLPLMTKNKTMYVGPNSATAINDPQRYPYSFSLFVLPTVTANVLARYCQQKGYKRVGVMQANSAAGQSQLPYLQNSLTAIGITAAVQSFAPNALDLTPQLEALKSQNPDALVLVDTYGRAALALLQNRQKLGWNVPTVGDTALATQDLAGALGMEALQNVQYAIAPVQKYVPPEQRTVAFNTFFQAVRAQGEIKASLNIYAYSYDALQVLNVAASQAKSTDVEALSSALENLTAPNSGPWVTYPRIIFSQKSHFVDGPPEEERVVVPAGPLVDGMIRSP